MSTWHVSLKDETTWLKYGTSTYIIENFKTVHDLSMIFNHAYTRFDWYMKYLMFIDVRFVRYSNCEEYLFVFLCTVCRSPVETLWKRTCQRIQSEHPKLCRVYSPWVSLFRSKLSSLFNKIYSQSKIMQITFNSKSCLFCKFTTKQKPRSFTFFFKYDAG